MIRRTWSRALDLAYAAGYAAGRVLRFAAQPGVAGLACVTAGAYLLAGLGPALLTLGAFLILVAWLQS